jgi:hypothetical protein
MNCTCKSTCDGHPGKGPHHLPHCPLYATTYENPPAEAAPVEEVGAGEECHRCKQPTEDCICGDGEVCTCDALVRDDGTCSNCGGQGSYVTGDAPHDESQTYREACPECGGTGKKQPSEPEVQLRLARPSAEWLLEECHREGADIDAEDWGLLARGLRAALDRPTQSELSLSEEDRDRLKAISIELSWVSDNGSLDPEVARRNSHFLRQLADLSSSGGADRG